MLRVSGNCCSGYIGPLPTYLNPCTSRNTYVEGWRSSLLGAAGQRLSVTCSFHTASFAPMNGDQATDFVRTAPAPDGRVPVRLRLGVTGHRSFANPVQVRSAMRYEVESIVAQAQLRSTTPVRVCAVTSLAAGADQMFAEVVLDLPLAELEVVLPLPLDRYEQSMDAAAFVNLQRLLERAAVRHEITDAASDEYAYLLAGHDRGGVGVTTTGDGFGRSLETFRAECWLTAIGCLAPLAMPRT